MSNSQDSQGTNTVVTEVAQIGLDDPKYGETLNIRLATIHNNFQNIVNSDFLRGLPGTTIGVKYVDFSENGLDMNSEITISSHLNGGMVPIYIDIQGQPLTYRDLQDMIKTAIINQHMILNECHDINHSIDLNDYSITLYYEYDDMGKYCVVSSLPFIYYDKNAIDIFAMDDDPTSNTSIDKRNIEDLSCALLYKKNEGFHAIHPFPQIYYDGDISGGTLCWKINGEKTSIPCQGVRGNDGKSAAVSIVYVDANELKGEGGEVTIFGALKGQHNTSADNAYEVILVASDEFTARNININPGDAVICVPVIKVYEGNEYKYKQQGGLFVSIIYTKTSDDSSIIYYIRKDGYGVNSLTPGVLNTGAGLAEALRTVGVKEWDSKTKAKGLFIPAEASVAGNNEDMDLDIKSYHMIWNDSGNNNSLNIGPVTNVADTNSLQNGKILNVKYNTILGPDGDEFDPCRNSELTVQHLLTFVEEVSHPELLYLRINEKLIPGKFYRITDYTTTTSQNGTSSAGHPFDVIVLALSNDKLSEEAWAMHSARDTSEYFAESKLEAWKIWYCLDNDTNRFAWACDDEQGKGVIYRMIDEFGNDCPYDFKNILMETEDRELKYTITYFDTLNGADIYRDGSLEGKSFNNIISIFHDGNKRRINNCILINGEEPCYDNTLTNCSECVLHDIRNSKLDNCTQCDLYYADDIQLYNCHEIKNENGIRNAIAYYTSKIVLEGNSFIFNGNILANRIYQSNQ